MTYHLPGQHRDWLLLWISGMEEKRLASGWLHEIRYMDRDQFQHAI